MIATMTSSSVGGSPRVDGRRTGLHLETTAAAARVVFTLYDRGLLEKQAVPEAMKELGLHLSDMVAAFGSSDASELAHEFVDFAHTSDTSPRLNWTYEEMVEAVQSSFEHELPIREVARRLGRTPDAVHGFFHRCFEQGYVVRVFVWELLREGYSWQEVADAGYPRRRCEFTSDLMRLADYCRTRGLPAPVLRFKE